MKKMKTERESDGRFLILPLLFVSSINDANDKYKTESLCAVSLYINIVPKLTFYIIGKTKLHVKYLPKEKNKTN